MFVYVVQEDTTETIAVKEQQLYLIVYVKKKNKQNAILINMRSIFLFFQTGKRFIW